MINFNAQDMEIFRSYCSCYNGYNLDDCETAPVTTLLKPWAEAKDEYLYRLMGEQLILEKHVTYERSRIELIEKVQEMLKKYVGFRLDFENALFLALGGDPETHDSSYSKYYYSWEGNNSLREFYQCLFNALHADSLVENRIEQRISAPIYDKRITINKDEKIMRAVRRVCELICKKTNNSTLLNDFEQFRLDLSRVMDNRAINGTLCLSIHPLDFATASDNSNDWSSCMSWREEGCYRLGTTEMLNSPMVICAYLKSDVQHLEWGLNSWNSKRWRAWIIVTSDVILCNRNYPFTNDSLSREAIEWVRELAAEHLNWHYGTKVKPISDWREQNIKLEFETSHMYNDTNSNEDSLLVAINKDRIAEAAGNTLVLDINYSGLAECMHCGDTDPDHFYEDGTLLCDECNNEHYCSYCGEHVDEDNYFDPNGNILCEDCFFDNCDICTECGETEWRDDMTIAITPYNRSLFNRLTSTSSWRALNAEHRLCHCCAELYGITRRDLLGRYIEKSPDYCDDGYDTEDWVNPYRITLETYKKLLNANRCSENVVAALLEDYKEHVPEEDDE